MINRVTVWVESLDNKFEPYYVSMAGIQIEYHPYPEYLSFLVETMLRKIVDKIGSTPCVLQARTERWILMDNGGYDYNPDWRGWS